jgi:cleavage and polyadenylation specificity factor subunit 1
MQTYTELTPPTAVSHCAAFPFTTAKATNLIVAKTSLLQIFDLVTITTEAAPADDQTSAQDIAADTLDRTFFSSDITLQRLETTTKLSLVAEYPLAGTVTSLGGVRIPGTKTGGAALVAAFRDAKLSLIEWDPERRAISTLSLHYFEHGLHISPWAPALAHCPAHLAVDPGQRCVLLRFGPRHIAILPFRRPGDDAADDAIEDVAGDQEQLPYKPSFVLPLTVLDPEIVFPSHLAFLHEYGEPTFGILSSIRAPSSAMSLERRDVMNYKVFTLDLDQKAVTTILSVPKLPTDLHQVVALPLPVGGSLLVGTNEVVHVDQSGNSFAVAVNSFARQSSLFPMADQSRLEMKLESCTLEPIGEHGELLMILQSGALALLSFAMEGRSVNNIRIQKVPSFQVVSGVSCLSALGRNRLFLGGEDNNSVILGWNRTSASSAQAQPATEENSEDDEEDYDDDDLYGGGAKLSKSHSRTLAEPLEADALAFRIHDALPNHAPTGEIALGKASPTESVRQMVYPVGRDRSGGLAVCRRQIDPLVRKTLDFTGANAVFAFHASGEGDAEAALSADAAWDQYLLVSRTVDGDEESALYAVARGKASRIERGEFEGEGGTVEVGVMGGGGRMVQVQSAEIRCYNSGGLAFLELQRLTLGRVRPGADIPHVRWRRRGLEGRELLLLRPVSACSSGRPERDGSQVQRQIERARRDGSWRRNVRKLDFRLHLHASRPDASGVPLERGRRASGTSLSIEGLRSDERRFLNCQTYRRPSTPQTRFRCFPR